ncbi:MAG: carboxypeptidase regulatory-like domain-containing protein, partial [Bacteroidota bacterium]|nr:carboxypeptidase regulatory-like domain-containing protein [Bacteroidota bacterium]
MRKRILAIVLLLSLAIFFAGCTSKLGSECCPTDGRVVGSIHGTLRDATDNELLEDVEIMYSVGGKIKTTQTNEMGYYAITNLYPGNYELTFYNKENYAIGRVTVNIPLLSAIGVDDMPTGEDFYYSVKQDMDLYEKTSGLTGTVYAEQTDESTILAPNVIVIADFISYDLSIDEFTTTTNSSGVFSFDSLPATPNVTIKTLPYSNSSYSYSVYTTAETLKPDAIMTARDIILSIVPATPFIVSNNYELDDFGITEDIVITFSKEMVTGTFDVDLYDGVNVVEHSLSWSNGVTLTIHPYAP